MTQLDDIAAVEAAFRQGYQAAVDELEQGGSLPPPSAPPEPPKKRNLTYEKQLVIRVEKLERLVRERDVTIARLVRQLREAGTEREQLRDHGQALEESLRRHGEPVPSPPRREPDGLDRDNPPPPGRDDDRLPQGRSGDRRVQREQRGGAVR